MNKQNDADNKITQSLQALQHIEPDEEAQERIFLKVVERAGYRKDRKDNHMKNNIIWLTASVAACIIIAASVILVPHMLSNRDTIDMSSEAGFDNPKYTGEVKQIFGEAEAEIAIENINIYYYDEDGSVTSGVFTLRCTVQDIFEKWAELNDVEGVSVIDVFYDNNGVEELHGDRNDPNASVSYTLGDTTILRLTLSEEFASYYDSRKGLIGLLGMTLYDYNPYDKMELVIGDEEPFLFIPKKEALDGESNLDVPELIVGSQEPERITREETIGGFTLKISGIPDFGDGLSEYDVYFDMAVNIVEFLAALNDDYQGTIDKYGIEENNFIAVLFNNSNLKTITEINIPDNRSNPSHSYKVYNPDHYSETEYSTHFGPRFVVYATFNGDIAGEGEHAISVGFRAKDPWADNLEWLIDVVERQR